MRDFGSLLLANWRLLKIQMVSQIALMVAIILLFWCSEQKIVHPAGKCMAELPDVSLQKKAIIADGFAFFKILLFSFLQIFLFGMSAKTLHNALKRYSQYLGWKSALLFARRFGFGLANHRLLL